MQLEGVYYSGKHSRGTPVYVERSGDVLRVRGGDVAQDVAIADIDIEPALAGMERHLRLPGGASLEMADTQALDSWFQHTGPVERFANWMEQRWPIAIGSLFVTAIAAWAIYAFVLPATATVIAKNMPQSWQDKVADSSLSILNRFALFESNIPLERQAAIRKAFAPMVGKLPDSSRYRLEFRRSPAFGANAFALPGGRMVVLDGLIDLTDEDNEIVAVLAHELGHAYHRHAMRNMIQSSFLASLVTIAVGDASGFASLPLIGLQAAHTRAFEREADAFALEALNDAGISPSALARMFEKLRDSADMSGNEQTIFSSHPSLNERIMKADAAAGAQGAD